MHASRLALLVALVNGLIASPSSGPGVYHLSDSTSGLSVDVTLLGVTSAAPQTQPDGSVIYKGAYQGEDLIERTTPNGVEDFIAFAAAPAVTQTDYTVTLGATVKGLRLVENVLEFVDAGGIPRIRIPPPFITGADGVVATALLSIGGCAYDTDPTPPWRRAPVSPGAATCLLHVSWAGQPVVYPATLDPSWTWTGQMVHPRSGHVAIALSDGDVLVAGGENNENNGGSTPTAEIFSPALNTWTPTTKMHDSRTLATGVRLADGRVLVVGGLYKHKSDPNNTQPQFEYAVSSAEIFDPATATWTRAGNLATARYDHAAAMLSSGDVLVCGGTDGTTILASCEDFGTSWSAAPSMASARAELTLTSSGSKVLAAGGRNASGAVPTAEILNGGAWTQAAPLGVARYGHVAVALGHGCDLDAAGAGAAPLASAERYAFATNAWIANASALAAGAYQSAAALANGIVVVTGGSSPAASAATSHYDGVGNAWSAGPSLQSARYAHTATALDGGAILVAGGVDAQGNPLNTSEVLQLKKGDGLGCATSADCASGFCVDSVCCNTACGDTCGACNLPGTEGLCAPTTAPHNGTCAGAGVCAGACSGQLGCSYPSSSTTCAPASCSNGSAVVAASCDGAGQCASVPSTSCAAYACGPTACKTSCAARSDCASLKYYCAAAQCQLDTMPPVFALASVTAEATSSAGAPVSFDAVATDNADGVVQAACTPAPGAEFKLGSTIVQCVATDLAGNVGTGSFSVTVQDRTPPALTLPQDITVEAAGASGSSVTYTASAVDLVDGAVTVVCDEPSGWVFPVGTTQVSCSAFDSSGNVAKGTFQVVVQDTTPPALSLPAPITAEALDASGAIVTFAPSATDLVDGSVAVTCSPASGALFPLGPATTVSCSASDAHHNTATGAFTVTVVDTTPPKLTLPSNLKVEATSAAGADVTFQASAADAVDGPVAVTCTRGTETLKSTDAGFSSVTPYAVDKTATIVCGATDKHGNAVSGQFTISVVDTMPPAITVQSDVVAEATSPSGAAVVYAASAADLVDGAVTPSCAPASGSSFPIGSTLVTCNATDAHGNVSTRSFTVSVRDATAPVLAMPANITAEAAGPSGTAVEYTVTASDVVAGAATAICSPASGSTFPIGTTTVSCTAADTSGNIVTGSFPVTVVDTTPPALTMPQDMSLAATSSAGAVATFSARATDLVDGPITPPCLPASGSTFPVGTTTVACSATDAAGNTATRSFKVTVTAPSTAYALILRFYGYSGTVTGPGISCKDGSGTCSANETGPVTLTAAPSTGYNVGSWTGCTPSADLQSCSVSGTSTAVVGVTFQPGPPPGTSYSLIVRMLANGGTVTGGGINCTDGVGTCNTQMTSAVTLTAQPATGYSVKSWGGCTPSADLSTCTVEPTANTAVNVTFQSGPPAGTPYSLIVRILAPSGTVTGPGISCSETGGTCSAQVSGNVTLTAQPASGYSVKSWSGCAPSADLLSCTLEPTSNVAVSVTFQSGPPAGTPSTLIVRLITNGGTVSGGGINCVNGTGTCSTQITGSVELTATPDAGYNVKSWSGCAPSADNLKCVVPANPTSSVNVEFYSGPPVGAPVVLNVRVMQPSGTITGPGISCNELGGACRATITGPVTLNANPASGYSVKSWSGCTPSADLLSCSVSGTENTAVNVTFQSGPPTPQPTTLTVRVVLPSGTVTGPGISCSELGGACTTQTTDAITLSAQPTAGYVVKSWSGCTPSADLSTCLVPANPASAVNVSFGLP